MSSPTSSFLGGLDNSRLMRPVPGLTGLSIGVGGLAPESVSAGRLTGWVWERCAVTGLPEGSTSRWLGRINPLAASCEPFSPPVARG